MNDTPVLSQDKNQYPVDLPAYEFLPVTAKPVDKLQQIRAELGPRGLMRLIIGIVCKYAHIPESTMRQRNRGKHSISSTRQLAMYFCYGYKLGNTDEVGNEFGGRDHGTVLHACDVVPNFMLEQGFRMLHDTCYTEIKGQLGNPPAGTIIRIPS